MSSGEQRDFNGVYTQKPDLDLLKSLLGDGFEHGEDKRVLMSQDRPEGEDFWETSAAGWKISADDVVKPPATEGAMGTGQSSEGQPELTAHQGEMRESKANDSGLESPSPQPVLQVVLEDEATETKDNAALTYTGHGHQRRKKRAGKSRGQRNGQDHTNSSQQSAHHNKSKLQPNFYIDMDLMRSESHQLDNHEDDILSQKNSTVSSRFRRPASAPSRPQLVRDNQQVLVEKYQELRELLREEDYTMGAGLDRQLLRQAKTKLRHYQQSQQGSVPGARLVAHPPPGPAPSTRGQRYERISNYYTCDATQTEGDTVLIDLSSADGTVRHVTFASGELEDDTSSNSSIDNEPEGPTGSKMMVKKKSFHQSRSRAQKKAVADVTGLERRKYIPKRYSSADCHGSGDGRSLSNESRSSYTAKHKRQSSSRSESETTDCSQSGDGDVVKTDHELKNTSNLKIRGWLKKKNKILRKQMVEKRRQERNKQKMEENKIAEKESRKAISEVKTKEWLMKKRSEIRLLKKREQEKNGNNIKFSGTVVIGKMMNLETGDEFCEKNRSDQVEVPAKNNGSELREHDVDCDSVSSNNHDKRVQPKKCTCGYTEAMKLKKIQGSRSQQKPAAAPLSQPDYTLRRKYPLSRRTAQAETFVMKGRNVSPSPPRMRSDDQGETKEKSRMSYDEWVKQKRLHDLYDKREEEKKRNKVMAKSDPEMKQIISDVAQKRVERIKYGRRRIETDIQRVDDAANNYPRMISPGGGRYKLGSTPMTGGEKERRVNDKQIQTKAVKSSTNSNTKRGGISHEESKLSQTTSHHCSIKKSQIPETVLG